MHTDMRTGGSVLIRVIASPYSVNKSCVDCKYTYGSESKDNGTPLTMPRLHVVSPHIHWCAIYTATPQEGMIKT
jgi:hypothetical protein